MLKPAPIKSQHPEVSFVPADQRASGKKDSSQPTLSIREVVVLSEINKQTKADKPGQKRAVTDKDGMVIVPGIESAAQQNRTLASSIDKGGKAKKRHEKAKDKPSRESEQGVALIEPFNYDAANVYLDAGASNETKKRARPKGNQQACIQACIHTIWIYNGAIFV